jgi:hypothetical protein
MYVNAAYRRFVETEYGDLPTVHVDGARIVATTDLYTARPVSLTVAEATELRDALDEAIFTASLLYPDGQSILTAPQLAERAA